MNARVMAMAELLAASTADKNETLRRLDEFVKTRLETIRDAAEGVMVLIEVCMEGQPKADVEAQRQEIQAALDNLVVALRAPGART